jgi:oligopeptide transport system substrate-binding protein
MYGHQKSQGYICLKKPDNPFVFHQRLLAHPGSECFDPVVKNTKAWSVFGSLGFALLLLATSFGCTRTDPDEGKAVLHRIIGDDLKSLDPAAAYDEGSLEVLPNIMEALYQYDIMSEEYRLIPLLAADIPTFSKDHLTVRIPLRANARYSDDPAFPGGKGRAVKASDLVFAIKRLADPKVDGQGSWIFEGKLKGFNAFQKKLRDAPKEKLKEVFAANEIEGARAVDDTTLELKLEKPYPQLLHVLTMTFVAPVAPEVVAKYGDEKGRVDDHPVGTGQFKFVSYDRGHEAVIERSPSFRGDPLPKGAGLDAGKPMPFLDKIRFTIVKENQPAWLKFLAGEADFSRVPKDSFNQAFSPDLKLTPEMAGRNISVTKISGACFYFINFNMKDKTLENKYLRQAMGSAIDRAKWIDLFTNNRGEKMVTVISPGIPDRVKDSAIKYDFNLVRAKELMKKAGFPDGKGLPIITFDMRGADSVSRQMGEFFTDEFAQIGVKLNVVYNTFPAFLEKQNKGQLQLSYGGWILDYPDVENGYQQLYAQRQNPIINNSNYDNPRYNALYEKIAAMDPGPVRAKVVKEMDDIIQEEVPWAFGFYRNDYVLVQPWVKNFRASFFTRDGYKYYGLDLDLKKKMKR